MPACPHRLSAGQAPPPLGKSPAPSLGVGVGGSMWISKGMEPGAHIQGGDLGEPSSPEGRESRMGAAPLSTLPAVSSPCCSGHS